MDVHFLSTPTLAVDFRNRSARILASVEPWSFLTNHARVLVCIAHDPGVRLRDIAERVGITERSAYGIVTDLTEAGYVVKEKEGRRNRYQVQAHQPLREPTARETSIGEILDLLVGTTSTTGGRRRTRKR